MVAATTTSILLVCERTTPPAFFQGLARNQRYRLVGRVDGLDQAREAIAHCRPDVVIVDVSTAERLREIEALGACGAKMVIVASLPPEAALLACMAAGARAYVRRPADAGLLEQAVAAVALGEAFVDPACTTWLVDLALHGHRTRPRDGLTLRQSQVVELVRGGLTNREIARVLNLSTATVKSHLHEAMRRLGATDRWAATTSAERRRDDRL